MKISERVRDFRKNELHLSQEEFGKVLGVSRDVIKNIELDLLKRPETKEPIIKLICKTYNLNEEWLHSGKGEKYNEDDEYTRAVVEIDKGDPKARQAILDYWQLTDENKKLFWKFIDTFIKK